MGKLFIFLILTLGSHQLLAEWTYAGRGNNGFTYVDYASRVQQGNKITLWQMTDYETPIPGIGLSSKTQFLYDCRLKTIAGIYMISYRENMGEGQVNNSFSFPVLQPIPIIPDSPEQLIFESVCPRR